MGLSFFVVTECNYLVEVSRTLPLIAHVSRTIRSIGIVHMSYGSNYFYQLDLRYANMKGCGIVKEASTEDGWHYFAYSLPNIPKYESLPSSLCIYGDGKIEELHSFIIQQKDSNKAYELEHSQH